MRGHHLIPSPRHPPRHGTRYFAGGLPKCGSPGAGDMRNQELGAMGAGRSKGRVMHLFRLA